MAPIDAISSLRDDGAMPWLISTIVSTLYYLCFALLLAIVTVIAVGQRKRRKHTSRDSNERLARRIFVLLASSLFAWQITLMLETRVSKPDLQLLLGRLNFASVAGAVCLSFFFVRQLDQSSLARPNATDINGSCARRGLARWLGIILVAETIILIVITSLTPVVDGAESVVNGHPESKFGSLFPAYLMHIVCYLLATLIAAFRGRRRSISRKGRAQLTLIAFGTIATGTISVMMNAVIPYYFGDFRWCDVGTLSCVFFLGCVAIAIYSHGLFDVRLVLRQTLVYGILLTVALGAYSSAVFVGAQYLTGAAGADRLTQFTVLFVAFAFDPLRRFLVLKTDRLLFPEATPDLRRSRNRVSRIDDSKDPTSPF